MTDDVFSKVVSEYHGFLAKSTTRFIKSFYIPLSCLRSLSYSMEVVLIIPITHFDKTLISNKSNLYPKIFMFLSKINL